MKFVCIGPAGEERSLIAAVMADRGRTAARSGIGAVMGSKRFKAVAVRGTRKIEVADPEQLRRLREFVLKYLREKVDSMPFNKMLRRHGTCDAPLAWNIKYQDVYTNVNGSFLSFSIRSQNIAESHRGYFV